MSSLTVLMMVHYNQNVECRICFLINFSFLLDYTVINLSLSLSIYIYIYIYIYQRNTLLCIRL